MKKLFPNIILGAILVFAFFVRIINITGNPPELFSDEITSILSARTILETGHDINGNLNLYLYNRLKIGSPIYGYLAAAVSYIFGENAFSDRLPAVLLGTLTVYLIYGLTLYIVKNKRVSILAAYVAAITPWNIYFSRIGWEPSLILTFILSGILLFYKSVGSGKLNKIILPYIILGLAVYGADALEFLAPAFLIVLIILNFKKIKAEKNKHLIGIFIFSLTILPYLFVSATNPLKSERNLRISTFATGITSKNVKTFTNNYLAHLSPVFLFEKGDPNLRQGTGTDGVLYWSTLPFILIGIFYSIKYYRKDSNLFLLVWLLIFPLGGSLTNDGVPHATRTLIGDPVFIIFFAIGFLYIVNLIKSENRKNIFIALFVLVSFFEFLLFAKHYFFEYPASSGSQWDYGTKNVLTYIKNNSAGSESLCLTNIEYWHEDTYTNFYLGYGNNYKITFDINDPACLTSDFIVLNAKTGIPKGYKIIDVVNDLEGSPIWIILKRS